MGTQKYLSLYTINQTRKTFNYQTNKQTAMRKLTATLSTDSATFNIETMSDTTHVMVNGFCYHVNQLQQGPLRDTCKRLLKEANFKPLRMLKFTGVTGVATGAMFNQIREFKSYSDYLLHIERMRGAGYQLLKDFALAQ